MFANKRPSAVAPSRGRGVICALVGVALLQFATLGVNASQGAILTPESSSVPVNTGVSDDLAYSVRCWQEGKEIVSETNFEWSAQSTVLAAGQWLTFTGMDGRRAQLTVMPVGTAVCQIQGRSKSR